MTDPLDDLPPLTNREKGMKPSRKHICGFCDGALTSSGAKCPRCGKIDGKGRHRALRAGEWPKLQ